MECKEVGKYLVSDPEVYHGELTFKGTRVPVETILHAFKRGYDLDKIAKGWCNVPREAVIEAIELATRALVEPYEPYDDLSELDGPPTEIFVEVAK